MQYHVACNWKNVRKHKGVDMNKIKVLFVCSGNICRSPLAHRLFEKIIDERGLGDKFEVDSCGTGAWHVGENADARMRDTAKQHGWKLETRARGFRMSDLDFDYIIAMDRSHVHYLKSQMRNTGIKKEVHLMREYDSQASSHNMDVPDPYYGGSCGFQQVYDMIDRSCKALLKSIIDNK